MVELNALLQLPPLKEGLLLAPRSPRNLEVTSVAHTDLRTLLQGQIARGTLLVAPAAILEQYPNAMIHIIPKLVHAGVVALVLPLEHHAASLEPRVLRSAFKQGLTLVILPQSAESSDMARVIQSTLDRLTPLATQLNKTVTNSFLDARRRFATQKWLTDEWPTERDARTYLRNFHLVVTRPYRIAIVHGDGQRHTEMLNTLFRQKAFGDLPHFVQPDHSIVMAVRRLSQITQPLHTYGLLTPLLHTDKPFTIGLSRLHFHLRFSSQALTEAERALEYGKRCKISGLIQYRDGI